MAAHLLLDSPYLPSVSEKVKDWKTLRPWERRPMPQPNAAQSTQKYPKDKDRFMIERAVNTTAATKRCM